MTSKEQMKLENITESKAPDGTYVAAVLSKASKKKVKELMINLGLTNRVSSDKMHITIIYSRKYVPELEANNNLYPMSASPIGLEVFDMRNGKRTLVLRIKSNPLTKRHNDIMDKYGTTYDFPEYNPHITLSYDIGEFDPTSYEGDLPNIELESEYVEDLVLDWTDK